VRVRIGSLKLQRGDGDLAYVAGATRDAFSTRIRATL
jgi:hypothetical protein